MRVEVDQSGKIGDTKVPTVLAFSNGQQYAIFISATIKRQCVHYLRKNGKKGNTLYIKFFSTALYFLLREQIKKLERIVIDLEYPGHEAKIKQHILNLFRRRGITNIANKIEFALIGKKSNAHICGLQVYNGLRKAEKIITYDEMIDEF